MELFEIMRLTVKFLYSDKVTGGDKIEDVTSTIFRMSDREFRNFIQER